MTRFQARERDERLREAIRQGQSDLDLDGPNERNGGDEPRCHTWAEPRRTVDFESWKQPPTAAEQAWIDAAPKRAYRYSWAEKRYVPIGPLTGTERWSIIDEMAVLNSQIRHLTCLFGDDDGQVVPLVAKRASLQQLLIADVACRDPKTGRPV
jgi:hypothetical protein